MSPDPFELSVESQNGSGSRFTLELPAVYQEAAPPTLVEPTSAE